MTNPCNKFKEIYMTTLTNPENWAKFKERTECLTDKARQWLDLGLIKNCWWWTKWLSKPTTFGKARRGCVTFREVAWIFTHQNHISQVSTRGITDSPSKAMIGLGFDNNDKVRRARSWSPGCLNCKIYSCIENLTKARPYNTFSKVTDLISQIYLTVPWHFATLKYDKTRVSFLNKMQISEYAKGVLKSITFRSLLNLAGIIRVIWPSSEKFHLFWAPKSIAHF